MSASKEEMLAGLKDVCVYAAIHGYDKIDPRVTAIKALIENVGEWQQFIKENIDFDYDKDSFCRDGYAYVYSLLEEIRDFGKEG